MKTKKLLVTLLVLTFILSSFSVGFAADEPVKLPSEVVRAKALGYLKGDAQGNLNLDKPVTRAEALALIVRISGLEKSAELMSGQTKFADANVDPSLQWATGYINLGVGNQIVNGYPDGTFKGNDQVTYAEMAKMLLYAMKYGVTVEGGVWPAAVMGKADDLDIFKKVNALPDLPALRGDVVKMIDNALPVYHLVQKGYGDLAFYEEDIGVNFLAKLDVVELKKAGVTKIAKAFTKLDDDEIELTEYDKNGDVKDANIYELVADVNPEEIFGLKVDAWVNDDDEVFFVTVKTDEKDILHDTVSNIDNNDKKLSLLVEDDDYVVSKDAHIYINFDSVGILNGNNVELPDVFDNVFGKVVLDRGEIVFANLFEFEYNGVVTKVTDEKIEYFKDSDSVRKLNLDDYDAYYVYDKNFKAVDVEDIDKDDAIFWFDKDDEIFMVVVNDKVDGELTRARDNEVTVDGKKIKTSVVANATISSNKNDKVVKYEAAADATEDLLGEDVIVILDVNGRVRHIVGDEETISGTNYGIVLDAYRSGRYYYADIFTKDGKKVEYKFEENADGRALEEMFYPSSGTAKEYVAIKFKLNADGEIDESFDKSDDILNVIKNVSEFDDDNDVIQFTGDGKFYVTSGTVLMNVYPVTNDDDDPELVEWDDIKGKDVTTVKAIYDVSKKDIKFIVFTEGIESTVSKDKYAVVKSNPGRDSDGWVVELDIYGEGIKELYLDKSTDRSGLGKGDLIEFSVTTKNKIKTGFLTNSNATGYDVTTAVYEVDGNYIKLNEGDEWTRISKDAVVYTTGKTFGNRAIDKVKSYSDIDVGDHIEVVMKDEEIVAVLIYKKQ